MGGQASVSGSLSLLPLKSNGLLSSHVNTGWSCMLETYWLVENGRGTSGGEWRRWGFHGEGGGVYFKLLRLRNQGGRNGDGSGTGMIKDGYCVGDLGTYFHGGSCDAPVTLNLR